MTKYHYYALECLGFWNLAQNLFLISPNRLSVIMIFVSQFSFVICQALIWANPDSWPEIESKSSKEAK